MSEGLPSGRVPLSSRIDFTSASLSDDELFHIWDGVSRFIERTLQNQKGVHVPNFGTFSFVQKKLDVGNSKFLLIQRPVLQLSEKICQTHGLTQTKYHVTGSVPVVQLNYAALSLESPFSRDKVETCVRETLGALNRSIASQRNVELVFCGVGRLQVRGGKVKFKFYKDFVNSLDQSGTVVRAMQERPGTADSVMSDRPASRAFSVALPKLSATRNGLAPIAEDEVAMGEAAAVQTDADCLIIQDSAAAGDEEAKEAPTAATTARPAAPVALATDFSFEDIAAQQQQLQQQLGVAANEATADAEAASVTSEENKENRENKDNKENKVNGETSSEAAQLMPPIRTPLPPPRPPTGSLQQQQLQLQQLQQQQQQQPKSRASNSAPSSCGHSGAGQELCYVCHQRQRRNVPVSFAEELKRREEEEDRLLHAYNEMRDKERILKEQETLLAKRHDAQKVSAFNLGITEAQREKRQLGDSDNKPSYIFQGRPLTPSRRIKQAALNEQLGRQLAENKSATDRLRADEAFLEKLEQVQLAEDLAAQRDQFLRDKEDQREMYRKALSAQLRYKPVPLPAKEPDSKEPIFGRSDVTEEKLLERRRKAQEVAQSQVEDVSAKRREELLRRLQEQKYEEEVLARTKEDLKRDRAWRYQRQENNRKGLEQNWSQAAQNKRQREAMDRLRASSPGGLLLEQCEANRRCHQCKRSLNNGGETNIWCESYYVPGTRYMS